MNPLLSMLLGLSLSGTLMALVLMLLRRLLGARLPSAFYYYAWLLVLLRFVLPLPGLMPGLARPAAAPIPTPAVSAVSFEGAARSYSDDFYHAGAGMVAEEPMLSPVPVVNPLPAGESAETAVPSLAAQRLFDLGQALRSARFWLSVWGIGAVLSALWYVGGYVRFRRELLATAKPARPEDLAVYALVTDEPCPRLLRSRAVHTPMLLGVLRPVILLPDKDFSPTMLQGILAHEMTHCRRGDVLFKWFAVLVSILHWFNPVTLLFRSELDRACELACDEMLLRDMNAGEKQLYGDMLLSLAADRRMPRSVVATSFAVEKRNLKERLVQIMTYKKRGRAALCLALAAMLLLSACGAVVGPRGAQSSQTVAAAAIPTAAPREETPEPVPAPENPGTYSEVTVDNIDDFLTAIAPNTMIFLKPGVYELSAATSYGGDSGSEYFRWDETYDGSELVISGADNLVISGLPGEEGAETVISAVPRYAQVIHFERCRNLYLSAFTAGHTQEPGQCAGGVLYFDSCTDVKLTGCKLYGCGTLGIQTVNCDRLTADLCSIYECSVGAVRALSSRDIRLSDCEIYDCGNKNGRASSMFEVSTSTGFAVINCNIHENNAMRLLRSTSADEVYLLGTQIGGNRFDTIFESNLLPVIVGGCSFQGNEIETQMLAGLDSVRSPEGEALSAEDLKAMKFDRFAYVYEGPVLRQAAAVTGIPAQDGMEYHVSTVDEFLAAIGSDRTIYLDGELFNLASAESYGGYGAEHYYWVDLFDGPGLVITDVENLRIIGQGKDETTLVAVPRYADVLCFKDCKHVTVAQLTAGHTEGEPGSCSGDVIGFEKCQDVYVIDCGLFGCGVWGIRANDCIQGSILRTEIYECSEGAATLHRTDGFVFTDCSVHDCYNPWRREAVNYLLMESSGDSTYNGTVLRNGVNQVGDGEAADDSPAAPAPGTSLYEPPAPQDKTEDTIHLFYFDNEITAALGGFAMHVGESEIVLQAQIWHNGSWVLGDFEWGVSDPDAIGLQPSENGIQCVITPLAPTEKGGAVLTVSYPPEGLSLEIPVYIVK